MEEVDLRRVGMQNEYTDEVNSVKMDTLSVDTIAVTDRYEKMATEVVGTHVVTDRYEKMDTKAVDTRAVTDRDDEVDVFPVMEDDTILASQSTIAIWVDLIIMVEEPAITVAEALEDMDGLLVMEGHATSEQGVKRSTSQRTGP